MNSRMKAQGFTLLEVLIAMILLAIGVLGMVGLQGRAIQYTQDSVQRNMAAMLANDLIEMMRAKQTVVSEGDPLTLDAGFLKATGAAFPDAPDSCVPLPVDADEQLGCWAASAGALLPGAAALLTAQFYVCQTDEPGTCSGTGDAVEIQVAWSVRAGECLDAGDATEDSTVCRYRLLTKI